MIKIKLTHLQLGVFITSLENILEIQQKKKQNLRTDTTEYLFLSAEQEILEQLKMKLQKKYIDRKKNYSLLLLQIHALLLLKYKDDYLLLLAEHPYFQNEAQLFTNEVHFQLLNK